MWKGLAAVGIAGVLWYSGKIGLRFGSYLFPELSNIQAVVIATSLYITTGGYYTLYLVYKTFPRDFMALRRLIKVRVAIRRARLFDKTVPKLFMENVAKNPNKVALIFEDEQWTFSQLDEYSNRVANCLLNKGFRRGNTIALFMENRPEYVASWLGATKIGVIPAFINFNLRQLPLVHCIKVANCKAVICGSEVHEAIKDVSEELTDCPIFVSGLKKENLVINKTTDSNLSETWHNMDVLLNNSSPTTPAEVNDGKFGDSLLYIYTSGTTGLPKAAIIKNARFLFFCTSVKYMAQITEDDRLYNPLPLYHSAGGMVGMGQVLVHNCSAVIRKKFSVSRYFVEAKEHGCTIGQYVGEICRYLLNSPPRPEDKQHKIRLMFGNGVRPQIWEQFTERFNNPLITEFYGATESNANIMNIEGKPGACGFLSVLVPAAYPVRLIKIDESTGDPVRDKYGLCIVCQPGEPGEFVGKIIKDDPIGDFHGYADSKATEKKIIKNVFAKDDSAFLSGDILVMDELGYIYFKDRMGDTFRWRGENVSTTEVEGVVSQVADHKDAVVYGVEVPNTEGKAGMAAIVDSEEQLDMKQFGKDLERYLPPYARPLFIRILKEIDTTGTFKLKKLDLQKDGFDLNSIKDKIYYLDSKKKEYVGLTPETFELIMSGKAGL